jgi:hypothetical protein
MRHVKKLLALFTLLVLVGMMSMLAAPADAKKARLDLAPTSIGVVVVGGGAAQYGGQINYAVTTSDPAPFVATNCYENGVWVLSSNVLAFPLPTGYNVTLSWAPWHTQGVAADCVATLYDGTEHVLATAPFHVDA